MGARPWQHSSLALPPRSCVNPQDSAGSKASSRAFARSPNNTTLPAGGDTPESPPTSSRRHHACRLRSPGTRSTPLRSPYRPSTLRHRHLGGAHAELTSPLQTKKPSRATAPQQHPHPFPQPRLAAGSALLRRRLATAAIDLSGRPLHRPDPPPANPPTSAQRLTPNPFPCTRLLKDSHQRSSARRPERRRRLRASLHRLPQKPASSGTAEAPITRTGSLSTPSAPESHASSSAAPRAHRSYRPSGWEHFSSRRTPNTLRLFTGGSFRAKPRNPCIP